MPTIVRIQKKKDNRPKRGNNAEVHKCYNTTRWRSIRDSYIREHPLCELCAKKGIIRAAEEVHHKNEISRGETLGDKRELAFDSSNLMALCRKCHHKIHNNEIHF